MKASASASALLLLGASCFVSSRGQAPSGPCQKHILDFILLEGEALTQQIEDDIRADLAKIDITVNTRLLPKADFNKAMQDGDFHLCFTETWGPPYDPHSFATGWFRPGNEAHYPALFKMEPPMTNETLKKMVTEVLTETNAIQRQQKWTTILSHMHQQSISAPMWSSRMPAVVNRRLSTYIHGQQQFDYPMHQMSALSGAKTITVSPGAQTGLFTTTGPMDPHSYRPNEFFISNWIYEGLVSYGPNGAILPQLATSWTITDQGEKQVFAFTLRNNVKFHDGEVFNCEAVKMTFDHVFQPPLDTTDYHGWYHLPLNIDSTVCDQSGVFVLTMKNKYYPLMQELSLIRPLRILSPKCYSDGSGTDPVASNSCPKKWKTPGGKITCTSVQCTAGTGPWKVGAIDWADQTATKANTVKFDKWDSWWGQRGDITQLIVKAYSSENAVKAALLSGELDMVVGGKVLTPAQVKELNEQHGDKFDVSYGPPLLNTIVVMNAARAPTNDIQLRKVVQHAIDKASIVAKELAGSAQVADSLYPKDAPYCNIELTPRWDYDLEKAKLLNCPAISIANGGETEEDEDNTGLILGVALGVGVPLLIIVGGLAFFFGKKKGYKQLQMEEQNKGANGAVPPAVVGNSA